MSLVDKLNLLRLVAGQPSGDLDRLLEQIRQGRQGNSDALFDQIKALVDGREPESGADTSGSDPE